MKINNSILLHLLRRPRLGRSLIAALAVAGALAARPVEGAATNFTLYVANYLAYNPSPESRENTVEEFDAKGTPSAFATNTSFSNPILNGPIGIAVDGSNNVYVTCSQDNTWIEKFDPWGNHASVFVAPAGGDPNGLAFNKAGTLYLATAEGDTILTYNPQGDGNLFYQGTAGFSGFLVGVAFDMAGNLYVSDQSLGLIRKIDTQTNMTIFASPGSNPYGLAFDSAGNLYAALRGNGTIVKYSVVPGQPFGATVSVFASLGAATQPIGLAFDPSGNLYASEYATDQIVKIDPQGNVTVFATTGLQGPAFIALAPKAFTVDRYVVAGGGGTSSNGTWSITGTAGQSHAGIMTGQLMSGEWLGVEGGFLAGPVTNFPVSTNLLTDGSFEFGSFVNGHGGDNAMSLDPGASNILGWTVTGTAGYDLAWIGPNNDLGVSAASGGYFLDLTGYHDSVPYDGVSQTAPTIAGQTYEVSFEIGYNSAMDGASGLPAVSVAVSGFPGVAPATYTFTVSGMMAWQTFQFAFVAAEASTTLTFTGATTQNIRYIGLDNVIMWAATASPSPIVMSVPTIADGQVQLPFTLGGSGTTFELQQSGQVTGPWTVVQDAVLVTNADGISGTFTVPFDGATQFYRVRSF